VLSGRTADVNLAFLATALNDLGIRVMEARVIRDDEDVIAETVNACRRHHDYVFTTGGIGPTHDDITAASIAKAFGVALERNPDAMALLRQQYDPAELNEARQKMADVPAGAVLIENPVSRAPGFQMENVFVLPGVPSIMRAMFQGIRGRLRGGTPVLSRTVSAFTREGNVATGLAAVQAKYAGVEIGSYPFLRGDRLGVSIVLRSIDPAALHEAVANVRAVIEAIGVEPFEETSSA
jgi:molybdenum cofactor synthesis domain-containing protein